MTGPGEEDPQTPRGPNGSSPGPQRPAPDPPPEAPLRIVPLALLFYGGLFGVALLWSVLSARSLLYASAHDQLHGIDWLTDAGAGALAGLIVILISGEITRRTRWGEALARALAELLGPLSLGACVLLAAVSAVAEEAFFRGALQPRVGLVAASLLFGLAHLAPRRELLPWTVFSVAAGFLLGWLFAQTGNLLAPVLAHGLINAVNLRLLSLRWHGG